jgi:hypothetical protein
MLGKDYGDCSFLPWEIQVFLGPGHRYQLQALAINRIGESQQLHAKWNTNGYVRNAVETVHVTMEGLSLHYEVAVAFLPYHDPCRSCAPEFGADSLSGREGKISSNCCVAPRSHVLPAGPRTSGCQYLLPHLSFGGLRLYPTTPFSREVAVVGAKLKMKHAFGCPIPDDQIALLAAHLFQQNSLILTALERNP